jgi:hypothetical protein
MIGSMKAIRSENEALPGFQFGCSSEGVRGAIQRALVQEFGRGSVVKLSHLKLLNHVERTFCYRARVNGRGLLGTAKVEIQVVQDKPGDEIVRSYIDNVKYEFYIEG